MDYDIAVIGGGPAGYTAAERAGANGLKAVLFEKKAMGGVCLNEGCIPTKTLLYSAKILDSIKSVSKYGVSAESPSFDLSKIMSRKDKTVKMLTGGVKMTVNSYGVTIVEKEAFIEGEKEGMIRITCDGETYSVKYLLVCTGSDTVIPPIPGLSGVSYWTSKEALEIKELPKTLVIIGGGVIGMEFASFFNSMGVKVHVVEMMPEILGAMDKETSGMLRAEYAKRGVTFYLNTKVVEVNAHGVVIEKEGKVSTIEAEKILLSVGRKANLSKVGLDKRGLAPGTVPQVPRGALIPAHSRRFVAAGRLLSSDRLANSALRVQAVCMATGQAAGAMAALSAKSGADPLRLELAEIRALLKRHGAIVPEWAGRVSESAAVCWANASVTTGGTNLTRICGTSWARWSNGCRSARRSSAGFPCRANRSGWSGSGWRPWRRGAT